MFAKIDLSIVYVSGKDNTVSDCLSCRAFPAAKAWMDISSHGDAPVTENAKFIVWLETPMKVGCTKCFLVMAFKADLSQRGDAPVCVLREQTLAKGLMAPIEYVKSVLMEDWSEDYSASKHCDKYGRALSAPWDDEWPEPFAEDRNKFFLKDQHLVPENRVKALIDPFHEAQPMHPGRDQMR